VHKQILQDIGVEQFAHVEKEVLEYANSQNLLELAPSPGIATHTNKSNNVK
jgi:hypothetical protein